jgi:CRP/FNR family transcriptional regulator, dissimilatory nitrate respiration regulator
MDDSNGNPDAGFTGKAGPFPATEFFDSLPEPDLQAFASAAEKRRYAKGDYIFAQENNATHFFIVTSGWVRLYRTTPDGREATAGVLTTGAVIGENAVFEGAHQYSAQAIEAAEVSAIPVSLFRERMKESPNLMLRVTQELARKLESAQLQIEHSTLKSALQRVGCLLLRLSANITGVGGSFNFPYDKKIAAQQLGMQRETFSRGLSGLRPVGVTVKGGEIGVDNFQRLTDYVCKGCSAYPDKCPGPRTDTTGQKRPLYKKLYFFFGSAMCDLYGGLLQHF